MTSKERAAECVYKNVQNVSTLEEQKIGEFSFERVDIKEEPQETDLNDEVCLQQSINYIENLKEEPQDANCYSNDVKTEPTINCYIYCCNCQQEFENFCPNCTMVSHILNNNVRMGIKNRAKKTLPKNILETKASHPHEIGVFALKTIPNSTSFGPYEGLETAVQTETGHAWRVSDGKLKNVEKLDDTNWMRYVNCTKYIQEKNLLTFQYDGRLYYQSDRQIDKGEELLVYYGANFVDIKDTEQMFEPPVMAKIDNIYACMPCCLGFPSEEYLVKHQAKCPYEKGKQDQFEGIKQCPFCKIFFSGKYLENHKKYCKGKLKRNGELPENHGKEENTTNIEKKFKCTDCEYQTNNKKHFKRHRNSHSVKSFNCGVCGKDFTRKSVYKGHILIHSNERPVTCGRCDYKCKKKEHLDRHIRRTHMLEKRYLCHWCPFVCAENSRLTEHMRVHTGEKPFSCNVCGKKFAGNGNLAKHMKIHLGIKYKCAECEHETFFKEGLKKHVKSFHPRDKPHVCEICNKRFSSVDDLETHMESNLKEFRCPECNYGFHYKHVMIRHAKRKHKLLL